MPQVSIPTKQEIEAAQKTISELKEYKSRNWGIGLNGETFQPDGFLKFFSDRSVQFKFYLRQSGVSIGESSAYDENISTLENYIQNIRDRETQESQSTINELKNYKERFWAIGLNGDTLEPDGFNTFFAVRNLPFKLFVRSTTGVSLGEQSAYDENIATLENHIKSL